MRAFLAIATGLAPLSAFAEVCDKMRPKWDYQNGLVGQIGEAWLSLNSLSGYVLAALVIATLLLKRRSLYGLTIAWCAILLIGAWVKFVGSAPAGGGTVWRASLREGCAALPFLTSAILLSIGLIMARAAWRLTP